MGDQACFWVIVALKVKLGVLLAGCTVGMATYYMETMTITCLQNVCLGMFMMPLLLYQLIKSALLHRLVKVKVLGSAGNWPVLATLKWDGLERVNMTSRLYMSSLELPLVGWGRRSIRR